MNKATPELVGETLRPLRNAEEYTEEERPSLASIRAIESRLLEMSESDVAECDAVPNGMGGGSVEWEPVDDRRVILMANRLGDARHQSVFVYWSTREWSDAIFSPTVADIQDRLSWLRQGATNADSNDRVPHNAVCGV